MRILFLSQILPYPLDAGPKTRAYYVLRYLAERHEVTLCSFVRATDSQDAIDHLRHYCASVQTVPMVRSPAKDVAHLLRSLASRRPFIIERDRVPAMGRMLKAQCALHKFDAVHSDQLWMAPYALEASRVTKGEQRPLTVLDQHNAVHLIPGRMAGSEPNALKRALLALEARKMARYEVETCRRFDRVVWVTEQDHAAVQQKAGAVDGPPSTVRRSAVIPICGDASATAPICRRPDARRVTFLGGLHWPPNAQGVRWFVEKAWPQVRAQVPNCTLTIIGKDPPPVSAEGIEVTGYVADLQPLLSETAVFIVPLLAGGGMRVKIVDAWMWGLPIVSTSIGAEGIDQRDGENILIADEPADIARAVVDVLQSREVADRLGASGRRWAEERYDWRRVYGQWDSVYAANPESRSIEC